METPEGEQREKGEETFKVMMAENLPKLMIKIINHRSKKLREHQIDYMPKKNLHLALILKQQKPKMKRLKKAQVGGGGETPYLQRTRIRITSDNSSESMQARWKGCGGIKC